MKWMNNYINQTLYSPLSGSRTQAYLGVDPIPGVHHDVKMPEIAMMMEQVVSKQ